MHRYMFKVAVITATLAFISYDILTYASSWRIDPATGDVVRGIIFQDRILKDEYRLVGYRSYGFYSLPIIKIREEVRIIGQ